MKQFITEKDDALFLVLKIVPITVGIKLDVQSIFNNFYPKILSIVAIIYSFVMIYVVYSKYPDAVIVPDYMDAFW